MKVIGDFSEDSQCVPLLVDGHRYLATWESDGGYVEIPGLTEYKVRVDEDNKSRQPVVYMRWLVADIHATGGKEGLLDALECHSPDGMDWAACLRKNCHECSDSVIAGGAIALLALIAAAPGQQGHGLGTPLAKAFAQAILTPVGVRAIWIKPVPLKEHEATGFFKPEHATNSPAFLYAKDHLEKHYERSLDAAWTCPDYLRADLTPLE